MTFTSTLRALLWVGAGVALAGCGKTDTTATEPTAASTAAVPVAEETEAAVAQATEVKVPDLAEAAPAQLARVSDAALAQIAALAEEQRPELAVNVAALQAALADDDAVGALGKLKQLSDYAQQVPGADVLIESTKQMVSAWALKQGFDTAQITPVLQALQTRDYASLASQAAVLAGRGGLSAEQKALVNGVLEAYGVDAKVDQAIDKLKNMF
ncbi:hypothetical protein [Actomonas aquatica]|uniref:Lipoprotein n=1 Tax=Actomonas aquatica TaxID=2866162 RepID=A0ABZ1C3N7_9BACT|nr:hypothetical protein [Opitutus sp. WL0086]WRQ85838.1 hypothetical protein K1X11_013580 [Opitutus sp. WL0086]